MLNNDSINGIYDETFKVKAINNFKENNPKRKSRFYSTLKRNFLNRPVTHRWCARQCTFLLTHQPCTKFKVLFCTCALWNFQNALIFIDSAFYDISFLRHSQRPLEQTLILPFR